MSWWQDGVFSDGEIAAIFALVILVGLVLTLAFG